MCLWHSVASTDNAWQQQGLLKNSFLEVSLCCVFPCSQRTEQKGHSEHQRVFIGGLFVARADLASAPSGGAWNKSFAGGNTLELPTQDTFTWLFHGATIVSEGTALETRDTAS